MGQATTAETIAAAVRHALATESSSSVSVDQLTDEIELGSPNLQIDSMAFIRALISIEDVAGIEISDDALIDARFVTVGDVVGYVLEAASEAEPLHD